MRQEMWFFGEIVVYNLGDWMLIILLTLIIATTIGEYRLACKPGPVRGMLIHLNGKVLFGQPPVLFPSPGPPQPPRDERGY